MLLATVHSRAQVGSRQAALVDACDAASAADKAAARALFRIERRTVKAAVRADMDTREEHVKAVHAASQARQFAMEGEDLRVETTVAAKAAARKALARSAAAVKVAKQIDTFEDRLARTAGGDSGDADVAPRGQEERIKAFLSDKERLQRDAQVRFGLDLLVLLSVGLTTGMFMAFVQRTWACLSPHVPSACALPVAVYKGANTSHTHLPRRSHVLSYAALAGLHAAHARQARDRGGRRARAPGAAPPSRRRTAGRGRGDGAEEQARHAARQSVQEVRRGAAHRGAASAGEAGAGGTGRRTASSGCGSTATGASATGQRRSRARRSSSPRSRCVL